MCRRSATSPGRSWRRERRDGTGAAGGRSGLVSPEVSKGWKRPSCLSGLTNMLDRPVVAEIAEQLGCEETAEWVREYGGLYAQGVFRGFDVEGAGARPPDCRRSRLRRATEAVMIEICGPRRWLTG